MPPRFCSPKLQEQDYKDSLCVGGGWDGYRMIKAQKWGRGEVEGGMTERVKLELGGVGMERI